MTITKIKTSSGTYDLVDKDSTLTYLHDAEPDEDDDFGTYQEGANTNNTASHTWGSNTKATGSVSHAEGISSLASGAQSHAEGNSTASAMYAHAEGGSTASGYYSHSEGYSTTASGQASAAFGAWTQATGDYQFVAGTGNVNNTSKVFIIGRGTSTSRNDAFSIDTSGNLYQSGYSVPLGNIILTSLGSNVSIATATAKNIMSVSLPHGVWLVNCGLRFASTNANTTGVRRMNFATTSGVTDINYQLPGTTGVNQLTMTKICTVTSASQTWYLNAYQTSGKTLTVAASSDTSSQSATYIYAVKIAEFQQGQ